ncbi:hypothetical protein PsAD46_01371 [Pseudovibrio sp. Ad46]|uniref:hypothetical protein n=1 Tax=unclassified Pseudovibrio TaxID=2627060 RepID=UPI0007AE4853|nr:MULTISPECIES: hypothetical protein [unclassified Pseudovibrio]KZK91844.1 hypothetical protein PsAD46_01371 [Pseudovibrio sp. Ad46]KZL01969.1 hypothetical protein PsAD5_00221 [Pseudovibrio sp. Ad5]
MPKYSVYEKSTNQVEEIQIERKKQIPGGTRIEGLYPIDMTEAELAETVKGTFGGRMEEFEFGRFVYVAYRD